MTGVLLCLTVAIAVALMYSQRKARRWSRLIGQGADMVRGGFGEQAESCLRGALAIASSARGPLWLSRRLSTLLPLAHLLLNRGQ